MAGDLCTPVVDWQSYDESDDRAGAQCAAVCTIPFGTATTGSPTCSAVRPDQRRKELEQNFILPAYVKLPFSIRSSNLLCVFVFSQMIILALAAGGRSRHSLWLHYAGVLMFNEGPCQRTRRRVTSCITESS